MGGKFPILLSCILILTRTLIAEVQKVELDEESLESECPPLYFMEEELLFIMPEGESTVLPCKTNAIPKPWNTWYKDEVKIKENLTYSFRLPPITRNHSGYYHCEARNSHGGIRGKRIRLEVGYLDPPTHTPPRSLISVRVGQALVIWPTLTSEIAGIHEGSSVYNPRGAPRSPNITIKAVPQPHAYWTLNNAPIPPSPVIYVSQKEHALVLLNIGPEMDSKVIKARLTNGYSKPNDEEIYTQSYVLQVNDPLPNHPERSLQLVLPPKDVVVSLQNDQPGSATFECVFNARPAHSLKVQWFRSRFSVDHTEHMKLIEPSSVGSLDPAGEPYRRLSRSSHDFRIYKFDGSGFNRTLTIYNITYESDSPSSTVLPAEEYTCQGYLENYDAEKSALRPFFAEHQMAPTVGPLSATASLRIYSSPKLRLPDELRPIVDSATSRTVKAALVLCTASTTVRIPCPVERRGYPDSEFDWLRDGEPVKENSERISVDKNRTLIIQKVRPSDSGVYQCYAHNTVGEDFLAFWVKVKSFAPQLRGTTVQSSMENVTVLEDEVALLSCPIDGAPQPKFTWYKESDRNMWTEINGLQGKREQSGSSNLHQNQGHLKISFAKLSDSGRYRCDAANSLGRAVAYVRLYVTARIRPAVVLPPRVTMLLNDSLQLQCAVLTPNRASVEFNWFHGRRVRSSSADGQKTIEDSSRLEQSRFEITYFTRVADNSHGGRLVEPDQRVQGSVLNMKHLTMEDAGIYVCDSYSVGGNLTFKSEIRVVSPPDIPSQLSVSYGLTNSQERSTDERGFGDNTADWNATELQIKFQLDSLNSGLEAQKILVFMKPLFEDDEKTIKDCKSVNEYGWGLVKIVAAPQNITTGSKRTLRISLKGLKDRRQHCVRVSAGNAVGWSGLSSPAPNAIRARVKTPTAMPGQRFFVSSSSKSIHLLWFNSRRNEQGHILSYQFNCQKEGGKEHVTVQKEAKGLLSKATIDGLVPMTKYTIEASVCSSRGCFAFGKTIHVRTKEAVPQKSPIQLRVEAITQDSVLLSFIPPSEPFYRTTGYKVKLKCIDPPGCPTLGKSIPIDFPQCDLINACGSQDRGKDLRDEVPSEDQTRTPVRVRIGGLQPQTLYEASVAVLSTTSSGPFSPIPEVFRTDTRALGKVTGLRVKSARPTELVVEWGAPEGRTEKMHHYVVNYTKPTTVKINITIQLKTTSELANDAVDISLLAKLLKLHDWLLQYHGFHASGTQEIRKGDKEFPSWKWLTSISCSDLHWYHAGQSKNPSHNYTTVHLIITAYGLSQYTHYRLRVRGPLFGLFEPASNERNASRLFSSEPSQWFMTPTGTPAAGPRRATAILLDARRVRIFWQPLTAEEWRGLPGGYVISAELLEDPHDHPAAFQNRTGYEELNSVGNLKFPENQTEVGPCGVRRLTVVLTSTAENTFVLDNLQPTSQYKVTLKPFTLNMEAVENSADDKKHQVLYGPEVSVSQVGFGRQTVASSFPFHARSNIRTWNSPPLVVPENITLIVLGDNITVRWMEPILNLCKQSVEGYQVLLLQGTSEYDPTVVEENIALKEHPIIYRVEHEKVLTFKHDQSPTITRSVVIPRHEIMQLLTYKTDSDARDAGSQAWIRISAYNAYGSGPMSSPVTLHMGTDLAAKDGLLTVRKISANLVRNESTIHGRVILSWKAARTKITRAQNAYQIRWQQIDPVTRQPVGSSASRLLSWPHSLGSSSQLEVLIAFDDLIMGATYVFSIGKLSSKQTNPDSKRFLSERDLIVHAVPDEHLVAPTRLPGTPRKWLSPSLADAESFNTGADHQVTSVDGASVALAWPEYPCSFHSFASGDRYFGPIYTAPVRNYTLQYIKIASISNMHEIGSSNVLMDALYLSGYTQSAWTTYQVSPERGQENHFVVSGLAHHSAYVFRIAALTDVGPSPFSEPSEIILTQSSKPCMAPTNVSVKLITVNVEDYSRHSGLHSDNVTRDKMKPDQYCQALLVQWHAIPSEAWNNEAQYYRVSYQLQAVQSEPEETGPEEALEESVFVSANSAAMEVGNKSSLFRTLITQILPGSYYRVGISAWTNIGEGPQSKNLLVYSGEGCVRGDAEKNWFVRNLPASREEGADPSQSFLTVKEFHCFSDLFRVEITCSWLRLNAPDLLGYRIFLAHHGPVRQAHLFSNSDVQGNSVQQFFFASNVTNVRFMHMVTNEEDMHAASENSVNFPLKPYQIYTVAIQALTLYEQGGLVHFPNSPVNRKLEGVKFTNDEVTLQENKIGCLPHCLCTAQMPPFKPSALRSEWTSRETVKLKWSEPVEMNGDLKAYRIRLTRLNQSSAAYQHKDVTFNTLIISKPENHRSLEQLIDLTSNSTYLFEVSAQTESKQNEGWGSPSCLLLATGYCQPLLPAQEQFGLETDCFQLKNYFEMLKKLSADESSGTCLTRAPEVYRPVIKILSIVEGKVPPAVTKSAAASRRSSYQPQRLVEQKRNATVANLTDVVNGEWMNISWSLATSALGPISQFLLEARMSKHLGRWYVIGAVDNETRSFFIPLADARLADIAADSSRVKLNDSALFEEADAQMVAAAFAEAEISPKSATHMAIQFRVSIANQFMIGQPSQGSNWIIIRLKTKQPVVYKAWWFLVALCLCICICGVGVAALLKASAGRRFIKHHLSIWKGAEHPGAISVHCCLGDRYFSNAYSEANSKTLLRSAVRDRLQSPNHFDLSSSIVGNLTPPNFAPMNFSPNSTQMCFNNSEQNGGMLDSPLGSQTPSNKTGSSFEPDRPNLQLAYNQSVDRLWTSTIISPPNLERKISWHQCTKILAPQLNESYFINDAEFQAASKGYVSSHSIGCHRLEPPDKCDLHGLLRCKSGRRGPNSEYNSPAKLHQSPINHHFITSQLQEGWGCKHTVESRETEDLRRPNNDCIQNLEEYSLHVHPSLGMYDVDLHAKSPNLCLRFAGIDEQKPNCSPEFDPNSGSNQYDIQDYSQHLSLNRRAQLCPRASFSHVTQNGRRWEVERRRADHSRIKPCSMEETQGLIGGLNYENIILCQHPVQITTASQFNPPQIPSVMLDRLPANDWDTYAHQSLLFSPDQRLAGYKSTPLSYAQQTLLQEQLYDVGESKSSTSCQNAQTDRNDRSTSSGMNQNALSSTEV
ncbi:unnamed protein product [Calicophoron daubneyi]|uniref:Uncharacterized protein n=1 Tax=Calicophoron daubneyi TaxID=300641 RepID=A0AAV2T725_CALDB